MKPGWRAVAGKVAVDNFVALPFEIPAFYACTVAPRAGWTAGLARLREEGNDALPGRLPDARVARDRREDVDGRRGGLL